MLLAYSHGFTCFAWPTFFQIDLIITTFSLVCVFLAASRTDTHRDETGCFQIDSLGFRSRLQELGSCETARFFLAGIVRHAQLSSFHVPPDINSRHITTSLASTAGCLQGSLNDKPRLMWLHLSVFLSSIQLHP